MKRLTTAKVTEIDKHLRRAHELMHDALDAGPKRKRVTASYLGDLRDEMRAIAAALDALATSPFLGVEAEPHRAIREPHQVVA